MGPMDVMVTTAAASRSRHRTPNRGAVLVLLASVSVVGCGNRATAYEHAQACEAELGPIPAFDLTDAEEVPILVDGDPAQGHVERCDHPAAFQDPCGPGTMGRLEGTHADGSANPDVVWVFIARSGGMGVIGYHAVTGATCFLEVDEIPEGTTVLDPPSVSDPRDYDRVWTSPRDMFEHSHPCQACHMADPFLHTPYIDQVADPDDPDATLVPIVAGAGNPRPPYEVIGSTPPHTTELPDNSCTSCHRPQCTNLMSNEEEGAAQYVLDELAMPAPFHDLATWDDADAVADRDEVRAWCDTLVYGR